MSNRLENNKVAARYARALFEAASAAGEAEPVARDLERVQSALDEVSGFYDFMANPGIPEREKRSLVQDHVAKGLGAWVTRILDLLMENGRIAVLPQLTTQYIELLNQSENITQAEVITAVELEQELRDRIRRTLETSFGYSRVELQHRVDPGILGGMVLKVRDQVIDGSYIGRLEELRKQVGHI
jgi:F-type H+-transporting ATPase subunit delta